MEGRKGREGRRDGGRGRGPANPFAVFATLDRWENCLVGHPLETQIGEPVEKNPPAPLSARENPNHVGDAGAVGMKWPADPPEQPLLQRDGKPMSSE